MTSPPMASPATNVTASEAMRLLFDVVDEVALSGLMPFDWLMLFSFYLLFCCWGYVTQLMCQSEFMSSATCLR